MARDHFLQKLWLLAFSEKDQIVAQALNNSDATLSRSLAAKTNSETYSESCQTSKMALFINFILRGLTGFYIRL